MLWGKSFNGNINKLFYNKLSLAMVDSSAVFFQFLTNLLFSIDPAWRSVWVCVFVCLAVTRSEVSRQEAILCSPAIWNIKDTIRITKESIQNVKDTNWNIKDTTRNVKDTFRNIKYTGTPGSDASLQEFYFLRRALDGSYEQFTLPLLKISILQKKSFWQEYWSCFI